MSAADHVGYATWKDPYDRGARCWRAVRRTDLKAVDRRVGVGATAVAAIKGLLEIHRGTRLDT